MATIWPPPKALNRTVLEVFDETQIYRIDHFLGKDTVQNLLVLRFGNGIFEPLWNRNYVDHVQITAAESLGVEQRAAFYETTGALRDMIQSHVLQLVSFVAIEPPSNFDATFAAQRKVESVAGPHGPSRGDGREQCCSRPVRCRKGRMVKHVAGYRQESGVKPDSKTDTFVAAKLFIDNWRWADVPFYIRTGKRMPRRVTEIAINFRRAPHLLFRGQEHRYQYAGGEYSARGRHLGLLSCQSARPENAPVERLHGFQLSGRFWRQRTQRLCYAFE